ncbi:hypothetical protein BCR44DRAFT_1202870 [Catenaria anguillulae PL171]|uniref:Uncharacterized protein n=1 Tax=Catenaria anguillulae PL171 TaxID=765915 RepID=A0A1Y2HFQ6_9FUNG|nr:hypothetical protein BCR44DRAFT_1202870 [Catenaria anguillulae PL171]
MSFFMKTVGLLVCRHARHQMPSFPTGLTFRLALWHVSALSLLTCTPFLHYAGHCTSKSDCVSSPHAPCVCLKCDSHPIPVNSSLLPCTMLSIQLFFFIPTNDPYLSLS